MISQTLPEIKCRYDAKGVPYLKTAMIDEYVAECLRLYNPSALKESTPLNSTHFLESSLDLRVSILHIVSPREDDPILGATSFNDATVLRVIDGDTGNRRLIRLDRGDVVIDESLYGKEAYRTEHGAYVRAISPSSTRLGIGYSISGIIHRPWTMRVRTRKTNLL